VQNKKPIQKVEFHNSLIYFHLSIFKSDTSSKFRRRFDRDLLSYAWRRLAAWPGRASRLTVRRRPNACGCAPARKQRVRLPRPLSASLGQRRTATCTLGPGQHACPLATSMSAGHHRPSCSHWPRRCLLTCCSSIQPLAGGHAATCGKGRAASRNSRAG
jgi:hypothetical protein